MIEILPFYQEIGILMLIQVYTHNYWLVSPRPMKCNSFRFRFRVFCFVFWSNHWERVHIRCDTRYGYVINSAYIPCVSILHLFYAFAPPSHNDNDNDDDERWQKQRQQCVWHWSKYIYIYICIYNIQNPMSRSVSLHFIDVSWMSVWSNSSGGGGVGDSSSIIFFDWILLNHCFAYERQNISVATCNSGWPYIGTESRWTICSCVCIEPIFLVHG